MLQQKPLIKLESFLSIGGNVLHTHSEHYGGWRGGNGHWFSPTATLNIHQPGETEEQSFYPAQSVSFRLKVSDAQKLSAYFASLARKLMEVEA